MSRFETLYPLWIVGAVLLGLASGIIDSVRAVANSSIYPLLVFMLFFTFLHIPFTRIRKSFSNRMFTWTSLAINFVWTPLLAYGLASLFLPNEPALWIGLIMLLVTPCTDWYLLFTGIAKGDVATSFSVLPLNLLLQLALLPIYVSVLTGASHSIPMSVLFESLVVLLIPLLFAFGIRTILIRIRRDTWIERTSHWPVLLLLFAIGAMFAANGQLLIQNLSLLGLLIVPLSLFFCINFFVSRLVGRMNHMPNEQVISLQMTTLARNSPVALTVAIAAFPNEPLIALVLIVGPLLELPVLVLTSSLIRRMSSNQAVKES
ncbi:arsenic resistance protein [Exiguobacterium sp.]|uniref:arsenic resistance protein n=1 Tax=Exiguobacterium sp. TaxID=44751 RepID=UPI00391A2A05